jgi:hypothetical protein
MPRAEADSITAEGPQVARPVVQMRPEVFTTYLELTLRIPRLAFLDFPDESGSSTTQMLRCANHPLRSG